MNDPLDTAPDANPRVRPGQPERNKPPRPAGHAHWTKPEKQSGGGALKDASRAELTATFGTGQPPRRLSGLLRSRAYRIPDYQVKRWALLLFADRVDKAEHEVERAAGSPLTWIVAGAAMVAVAAFTARRRPRG